jgi:hypothetical protein
MDRDHMEDPSLLQAHVRALHDGAIKHETAISTMRRVSLRRSLVLGYSQEGEHDETMAPRERCRAHAATGVHEIASLDSSR